MAKNGLAEQIMPLEARLALVLDSTKTIEEHSPEVGALLDQCWEQCAVGETTRLNKYGTTGAVELLFQRGLCGICALDLMGEFRQVRNFDHCHKTGIPRGWLCAECNQSLGRLGDYSDELSPKAKAWVANQGVVLPLVDKADLAPKQRSKRKASR